MQTGELRERVSFFAPVDGVDGSGNTISSFNDFADFVRWASVVPRLGGETVLAGRLAGRNLVNLTVRQSGSTTNRVTTDWQARNEKTGTVYNIRSIIDPDQSRVWWEMLCEIGVA